MASRLHQPQCLHMLVERGLPTVGMSLARRATRRRRQPAATSSVRPTMQRLLEAAGRAKAPSAAAGK